MDLRHMHSFIAIAEELHFGRAAQRLNLTQPSLSAQLQKLEKSIGVQLVVRSSHEVRLTPAGLEFEVQARSVVAQLDRVRSLTQAAANGWLGRVDVGYNLPASRHVLPGVLTRMAERYPKVDVRLWERRTGPQLSDLQSGMLDVAMVYGKPTAPDISSKLLLERIPIVGVVGRGHRLAHRDAVPFAELAGEKFVLFQREQCPAMHDAILNAATSCGVGMSVAHTADDPGATEHLVAARPLIGFASLPRVVSMGLGSSRSGAVAVKIVSPTPSVSVYAAWRSGDTDHAVARFLECVDMVTADREGDRVGA